MCRSSKLVLAITVSFVVALLTSPVALAQPTNEAGASTPKQVRKAQRKAARAKKNAELHELQKNGYNPAGAQQNYPQDLQNAERKAQSGKAVAPAPASAP
jgi:hypothetical protein